MKRIDHLPFIQKLNYFPLKVVFLYSANKTPFNKLALRANILNLDLRGWKNGGIVFNKIYTPVYTAFSYKSFDLRFVWTFSTHGCRNLGIVILLAWHKLQFKTSLSSGSKEDPVLCVSDFPSSAGYSPAGFYAARGSRYSCKNPQTHS